MANVLDTILRKLGREPATPAAPEAPSAPPSSPAPGSYEDLAMRGADPRRLAEEKANEAGRRWREQAVAKGEIEPEIGGPQGLEPTRYGDWEKSGRCVDF
ncbi:MAG: DUF1674 domain-containing protein [Alphaproteobacteria bacterium]